MKKLGKRSRITIFKDILLIISSGKTVKTQIMQSANLSYYPFNEFYDEMLKRGYITFVLRAKNGSEKISITLEGRKLLSDIKALEDKLPL